MEEVETGKPVFTCEGKKLGEVKESNAELIKVGGGLLGRSYWLDRESVEFDGPDGVMLSFPKEELDQHKRAVPA